MGQKIWRLPLPFRMVWETPMAIIMDITVAQDITKKLRKKEGLEKKKKGRQGKMKLRRNAGSEKKRKKADIKKLRKKGELERKKKGLKGEIREKKQRRKGE